MNTILVVLSAVVNSLWQALAVAALVWLALKFMPRGTLSNNAATRYAIWWATLGVVLILPVAPRLILMMRAHPQPVAVTALKTSITTAPASAIEPLIVTVPPGRTAIWPIAVLAVWAAILLWRLFQIVRSYFYLRGVKRRSAVSPIPLPAIPRRADLLISPDIVSPMAVGFLRPAIVLPESLLEELSEPEREHVLLHESAHLAKYDDWSNLAMRLLAGALALHPVAIWILWRIEREREMACDDWVVARTGAARSYAASLAHLFELRRAKRGEILASGIFGSSSRIGERIEMLLRRGRTFSPRASAAGIAVSAIVLGCLMLAASLTPRWIAFAQQGPETSFEVASIRLNPSGSDGSTVNFPDTGRLSVTNATVKTLIRNAWGVQNDQIAGGPGWLDTDKYDIQAKTARPIGEDPEGPLMQSLLADRFHLKVHRDARDLPFYALILGKGGPKFKKNTGPNGSFRTSRGPGRVQITVTRVTMGQLAGMLGKQLGRVVQDKTELRGYYNFALEFDPEQTADSSMPSIFAAVQEQLGLKLEAARGPVPILVIDHVEKPDAN